MTETLQSMSKPVYVKIPAANLTRFSLTDQLSKNLRKITSDGNES